MQLRLRQTIDHAMLDQWITGRQMKISQIDGGPASQSHANHPFPIKIMIMAKCEESETHARYGLRLARQQD
ncbi:MAG: hypothetical protein M5U34_09735 [Chloroflexi bacterium]|nr:hypothetical protein [Chloroflexota bacterium]